MGDSVFITEHILLDQSPIDLYNITIETGGSLVADPETNVVLRAANIYVEGSFEIGSEPCPFQGHLNIILTGLNIINCVLPSFPVSTLEN